MRGRIKVVLISNMDISYVILDSPEESGEQAHQRRLLELILLLLRALPRLCLPLGRPATFALLLLGLLVLGLLPLDLLPQPVSVALAIDSLRLPHHIVVLALRLVRLVHKVVHLHQVRQLVLTVVVKVGQVLLKFREVELGIG